MVNQSGCLGLTQAAEAVVRVASSYADVDRRWDLVITERDTMLLSKVLQTVTNSSPNPSLAFFLLRCCGTLSSELQMTTKRQPTLEFLNKWAIFSRKHARKGFGKRNCYYFMDSKSRERIQDSEPFRALHL